MKDLHTPPSQQSSASVPKGFSFGRPATPGTRHYIPFVTYGVIFICTIIFAYLNLFKTSPSYKDVTEVLIPRALDIWSGNYWGLITTAFVHIDFVHFFFNMYWALTFGAFLEPSLGRKKYALLIFATAILGSGAQLAISNQTGIGYSGVVYGLFGYVVSIRHLTPRHKRVINNSTVKLLLGWLVLCIVLTYTGVWNIANGAHVAGFLSGYFIGNVFVAKKHAALCKIGLALLIALMVMSLTYLPWSEPWISRDKYTRYFTTLEGAATGDAEAQFEYANILVRDYGETVKAASWLKKSANQGYIPAMNQLARMLTTDINLRNGKEAIKWAEKACNEDGWKTADYIDTLAAAYASEERWSDAVATQKKAISKLTQEDEELRKWFESRLQSYINKKKIQE